MSALAPTETGWFEIRVVLPNGDLWDVGALPSRYLPVAVRRARRLRQALRVQSYSAGWWDLPPDLREFRRHLARRSTRRSACLVGVYERIDEAGEQAPNGWRTVCLLSVQFSAADSPQVPSTTTGEMP